MSCSDDDDGYRKVLDAFSGCQQITGLFFGE